MNKKKLFFGGFIILVLIFVILLTPHVQAIGDVSGTIFRDTDEDAVHDLGEDGLSDVTVQIWIDADASGGINPGDTIEATVVTDSNGDYSFSGLADDDYILIVTDAFQNAEPGARTTLDASLSITVSGSNLSNQDIGFADGDFTDGSLANTAEINHGTPNGPSLNNNDTFGKSIANLGILAGVGGSSLAIGAPGNGSATGAVYVLTLSADGVTQSTATLNSSTTNGATLSAGDEYGTSVASIGDLNEDGVQDIIIGAFNDDNGGTDRGAVHIHYLRNDATVISTVEINDGTTNGPALSDNDFFGISVADIGDLNDDGVRDIAVGAVGDSSSAGAVHIMFMNTNGTIDSTVEINSGTTNGPTLSAGDFYGRSIAGIGDLDGDGVEDIAVGAVNDDGSSSNRGAIHIHYMNTDGSIDSTVEINDSTTNGPTLSDNDFYGISVTSMGDLDGDGVQDLAIGASSDDNSGTDRGAIHISFMNTDGSIDSTVEINDSTTNGPTLSDEDYFGLAIANGGDIFNDGSFTVLVGAPNDDNNGTDRGAIHMVNFDEAVTGSIAYTGDGFTEPTNDGSVTGSIIATLTGDTFQDTDADNVLDVDSEVTLTNIPAGLTPSIALTSGDTIATLTLSGNATSHLNIDDVSNIQFTFDDSAFTAATAANVTNATGPASSNLGIDFTGASGSQTVEVMNASISINAGEACTAEREVVLTLGPEDATEMLFTEDELFVGAEWVAYSSEYSFTLSEADGVKSIYAMFRSETNDQSGIVQDSIILDQAGACLDVDETVLEEDENEVSEEISTACEVPEGFNYEKGTLALKSPNSAKVYYYGEDGCIHWFETEEAYFQYFDSWNSVLIIDESIIESLEEGDSIVYDEDLVEIEEVPEIDFLELEEDPFIFFINNIQRFLR